MRRLWGGDADGLGVWVWVGELVVGFEKVGLGGIRWEVSGWEYAVSSLVLVGLALATPHRSHRGGSTQYACVKDTCNLVSPRNRAGISACAT